MQRALQSRLTFKVASEPEEFGQVSALNYRTFVDEIPQHESNEWGRLADPYLERSTCLICLDARRLVGMVTMSGSRPFSLDRKLPELDSYLPAGRSKPCEIRLLAVEPAYRRGPVFAGLLRLLMWHCQGEGYDVAVISGHVDQERMYGRLGFEPFGPRLGGEGAFYQGMYITWPTLKKAIHRLQRRAGPGGDGGESRESGP